MTFKTFFFVQFTTNFYPLVQSIPKYTNIHRFIAKITQFILFEVKKKKKKRKILEAEQFSWNRWDLSRTFFDWKTFSILVFLAQFSWTVVCLFALDFTFSPFFFFFLLFFFFSNIKRSIISCNCRVSIQLEVLNFN